MTGDNHPATSGPAIAGPARPTGVDTLPERLSPAMLAAAGALVLLHVALACSVRQATIATGNDDALYLLLGRAIRAFTFRDLHVLGQPWHSQYPPGYPLLLGLLGGTLGPAIGGALALGIALSAVSLLGVFDIARRFAPPGFALAVLAALAVNPQLLAYAGSVRSETSYIALTVAGLWCVLTCEGRRAALAGAAALALLAALTRWIGVALIGAVAVAWLLERRWARVGWLAAAALLTVGVWMAWTFLAPEQHEARSYGVMLTQTAPTEAAPSRALLARAIRTVDVYLLRGALGNALGLPWVEGGKIDNILGLAFAGALVLAGMVASWRQGRVVTLYTLLYLTFLAVWTYKLTRFLVPLTPMLLLLAAIGAGHVASRLGRRWRGVLLAVFAAVFLAGGIQGTLRLRRDRNDCAGIDAKPNAVCLTERQKGFFHAIAFLRDSTSTDALVITTKEAVVAIYTGRTVLHSQAASRRFGALFLQGLREQGEAYILLAALHRWQIPKEMLARCDEFELVRSYRGDNDLVRLRPPGTPAVGESACRVIQAHAEAFRPPLARS